MHPSTRRAALRIAARLALASTPLGCGIAVGDDETGSDPRTGNPAPAPTAGVGAGTPPGPPNYYPPVPPPAPPAPPAPPHEDAGAGDAWATIDAAPIEPTPDAGAGDAASDRRCEQAHDFLTCCGEAVGAEIAAGGWTLGASYTECCNTIIAYEGVWQEPVLSEALGPCCELLGYPSGPACSPWGPPMPPTMPRGMVLA